MATDARAVVSEGGRLDPVDGTQIVEVLGPGALQPAFVRAEKRFPDAGSGLAVTIEQGAHLFDHIGKGDPVRETV
ncbi:hypothetical protein [Sphaerisporangium krabiense]|uniref:Uncharacterized protein n=1 Tax=Sphaerisporangium krabiense TaxID=763782 RepID=A0A7W9DRV3_9ACTN|nr:hypothetical protein [Sphaerisporangium krabiense]MBB5628524.1 hypothetical protein [Sphaerisporangium krabiense]